MKVVGLAFLIECAVCRGTGKFPFPGIDYRCIKCEGHGKFVQPANTKAIKSHLKKEKV